MTRPGAAPCGSVHDVISHILRCQWLNTLVHLSSLVCIAAKADEAKLSTHSARADHRDSNGGANQVMARGGRERVYSVLGRTVYAAQRVGLVPGGAPDIDEVPCVAGHHLWRHGTRHRDESSHVGLHHSDDILQRT